ncbi:MAG: CAAX amino terminal protease family [Halonotius sp. J07HN6]|nr:MAG: CAAX amino terminal protease family [Halonotius sp. J07HN6]
MSNASLNDDVTETLISTVRSALFGSQDGQLRCSWRVLIAVVITFAAVFGFIFIAKAVGIDPPGWAEIAVVHPAAVIGVLIAMALLKRYVDHRDITDYGFNLSGQWGVDALAGFVLAVLLEAGLFAIEYQRGGVQIIGTWTDVAAVPIVLQVGILVFGWIALGFWEETLFRGIFIPNAVEGLASRGLSDRTVTIGALLSSSVVFGFGHVISGAISTGDSLLYALVVTSISGVLLGWAYLLSGELAFPIGLHTGGNLATTMLISSSGATYPKVVEYSVSGRSIGFNTSDPAILFLLFAIEFLIISGYFYFQYGAVVPDPNCSESPSS